MVMDLVPYSKSHNKPLHDIMIESMSNSCHASHCWECHCHMLSMYSM